MATAAAECSLRLGDWIEAWGGACVSDTMADHGGARAQQGTNSLLQKAIRRQSRALTHDRVGDFTPHFGDGIP